MGNENWHISDQEKVEKALETSFTNGLTNDEVNSRLEKYGPNELESKGKKSIFKMLIEQFSDFMVIILIIAAVVSGLLGELTDSIIILLIVILNAVLGIIQENKAENSLAALKKMAAPHAKVKRSGNIDVVSATNLVPGDVVILETGDFVPADIRLFNAANLKIQEAALTGESVPVEKEVKVLENVDSPLGDRINMAYTSSLVTYGRGSGIVVETGMATEMGKIAEMIQTEEGTKTPLQKRLEVLGKTLGIAALAVCAVIFLVGILYGKDVLVMFMTSVSLAVAAIPEGLPAIVTIVLAIGVQRMIKRNAIIRKLPSVETLGSATVICSDKTGTLTQNKMTVEKVYLGSELIDVSDFINSKAELQPDFKKLITVGMACNDTQIKHDAEKPVLVGDPTETALVDLGLKMDFEKSQLENEMPRVDEIPFDSDRKLMTTVHKTENGYVVFTKGAPDELLERCNRVLANGNVNEKDPGTAERFLQANTDMGSNALRVLGMAYKELPEGTDINSIKDQLEQDLIFVGMMGMIDPPREEAKEAVKLCKRAGIRPVMITGDHKITASAIAKELGILNENDGIMTGAELDKINDDELREKVKSISVYARVSPEHKVRIVKAWQSWNEVVAMTGDGVNDAPALKRADIGAAMGIVGTEVAKEAADMVLTDDNFATVVSAVEEGRVIFANIQKTIQFLLSCNVGEILVLFTATMLNWDSPLLPIHILWVNLVTDSLPALALGVDPAEAGIMDRKPRSPDSPVFDKGMVRRILYQGVMVGALTLIGYWIGHAHSIATGQTMAFAILALSQLVHSNNVHSNKKSLFKTGIFANTKLIGAISLSAILQLLVLTIPFLSSIFKVEALRLSEWIWVLILSFAPLLIVEIVKLLGLNTTKDEA